MALGPELPGCADRAETSDEKVEQTALVESWRVASMADAKWSGSEVPSILGSIVLLRMKLS